VYDIVREFDKCENPDDTCPKFGTFTKTDDQLGFSCVVNGDVDQVTLTYHGLIDYTVVSDDPCITAGTTNIPNTNVTLDVVDGLVEWHYDVPTNATADMISLTVDLSFVHGECQKEMSQTLKTAPVRESIPCASYRSEPTVNPETFSFTVALDDVNSGTSLSIIYNAVYDNQDAPVTNAQTPTIIDNFIDNPYTWPGGTILSNTDHITSLVCTLQIMQCGNNCGDPMLVPIISQQCPKFDKVEGVTSLEYGSLSVKITNLDPTKIESITVKNIEVEDEDGDTYILSDQEIDLDNYLNESENSVQWDLILDDTYQGGQVVEVSGKFVMVSSDPSCGNDTAEFEIDYEEEFECNGTAYLTLEKMTSTVGVFGSVENFNPDYSNSTINIVCYGYSNNDEFLIDNTHVDIDGDGSFVWTIDAQVNYEYYESIIITCSYYESPYCDEKTDEVQYDFN
jgi:hypothetical protein